MSEKNERKKVDEALREKSIVLDRIIASSAVGIITFDENDRIRIWNIAMEGRSGILAEEVIGQHPLDLFPFLKEQGMWELFERAKGGETVPIPDYRYEGIDASHSGWATGTYGPLTDEKGEVTGVIAITYDITDRKLLERETEERRGFLERILAAAPDAIVTADNKHAILEWNLGAQRLFGYSREESIGHKIDDLISGGAPNTIAEATRWTRSLEENQTVSLTEAVRYRKDGTAVDVLVSVAPILTGDERFGVVAIYTDITERKQLEVARRKSSERFQTVFQGAPMGIAIADPEGKFLEVNDYFARALGYSQEEMQAFSFMDITYPEDREETAKLVQMVQSGKSNKYEMQKRYLKKDGGIMWGRLLATAIRTKEGTIEYWIGTIEDVTEKRQAQLHIARLLQALESTTDGIGIVDQEGHTIFVNASMKRLSGFDIEELNAKGGPLEVYAQREIAERALSGAFAGNSWHGELALLRKDGTTVPIEGTADPIFDDAGELIGIIGVHRDISERIESERRLRESEERFRAAFENAVVGKGLVLPSAEILRVNDSLAITLGMTREELEHTTWMEYIDPEYISVVHQKVQDLLNGEYPSAHMEMKLIRKDGNRIWARVFGVVVHDPDGRPLYIVADVEDISHLKDYEDQLRKYEQIVSASKDLMSLVSRDFVYEAVNDKYLEYYALSREEIIGRTVWEIMGQQSFATQINSRLEQAFSGEPSNYQDHFDYAGCGRRYMDVSYFPLFGAEGKVEGVVVNARDITETKKLEEQLLQSQKIESIGTLAGGVAHEINNPINGIMNYAQLIADRLGDESPEAELADEIIRETKRVATIVQNLLTFARHEKQSHSPAYLSDIVSAVLSLIQTVMRHDQIDLQVNIADGLPKLKCRSQEIQQVLMNLMTNARDALNERYPEYSPEKKLRLSARLIKKGGKSYIRTTVEDTGPGIPLEIRERIFDPFFTNKPKEKGTGLGLSISYGIVKSHHGKLLVESELGQYTRFHMDLPVDNGWKLE